MEDQKDSKEFSKRLSPEDLKKLGLANVPSGYIRIKVVDQSHHEIEFRVKLTTKMSKVKQSYCERLNLYPGLIRFLRDDGVAVNGDATPAEMELKDDDIIEVFSEQNGGGVIKPVHNLTQTMD